MGNMFKDMWLVTAKRIHHAVLNFNVDNKPLQIDKIQKELESVYQTGYRQGRSKAYIECGLDENKKYCHRGGACRNNHDCGTCVVEKASATSNFNG